MNLKEVIYFGLMYTLIFTGYYVTNGFLTLIYPNEAFIGFAIFYGVYALFSLVAPYIFWKMSLKASLICSAFTFLVYVGLTSSRIGYLMLIGSGICGLGNAMIWLSQGQWMSGFPNNDIKSTLMGIFWGLFYASVLVGNIIGLIVLVTSSSSINIMMWTMIGVTGIGVGMTFFIRIEKNEDDTTESNKQFFQMLKEVFTIIKVKRGYCLIPFFLTQAIALAVTYLVMTKLITQNTSGQDKSIYTAAVFIAYGGTSAIGSLFWGKMYDKSGWKPLIIVYIILEISSLVGILLLGLLNQSGPLGYWIIIGFFRGISDTSVNTLINVSIVQRYNTTQNESGSFFGIYRFLYATMYAVFAVLVAYIPYQYYLLICGLVAVVSVIFYYFFTRPETESDTWQRSRVMVEDLPPGLEAQFDKSAIRV